MDEKEAKEIKARYYALGLDFAKNDTGLDGIGEVGPLSKRFARWFATQALRWRELEPENELSYYFLCWENGTKP